LAMKGHKNSAISVGLLAAGVLLVLSARAEDGWAQAWRVEVGAAIGLLGPLFFIEELLRSRVASLEERFSELRKSYGLIRQVLPEGDARTYVLDRLLEAVTKQAKAAPYSSVEVARFLSGDEETRTIAFAAMQGDHKLIDDAAVIRSITSSSSGMEQYHALKVAHEAWQGRSSSTKTRVVDAIREDMSSRGFIAVDPYRRFLAEEILRFAVTDGLMSQSGMDEANPSTGVGANP